MLSPEPELVWEGRIQLGDEPGVYGDAAYTGLTTEFPMTLFRGSGATTDQIDLTIEAEHVSNFKPYPGHQVVVRWYEDDGTGNYQWKEVPLVDDRLKSDKLTVTVKLPSKASPAYISCSVRIDTTVAAGLYNDFVMRRLTVTSANYDYTASFGFQNG